MATGIFEIYYEDGGGLRVPCGGVRYAITGPRMQTVATGVTDARGRTQAVSSFQTAVTLRLRVFNDQTQRFEEADIVNRGPDTSDTIDMPAKDGEAKDKTETIRRVRVKPYFLLQFTAQATSVPIPGVQFAAYSADTQQKSSLARAIDVDKKAITGSTDSRGFTPLIFCEFDAQFVFEVAAKTITQATDMLSPIVKGQTPSFYPVQLKGKPATTQADGAHTVELTGKTSLPILLNAEDEELLIVPKEAWKEFEQLSGLIESTMTAAHQARADLTIALERDLANRSAAEIANAEKALGLAEDKVKSMLNKDFKKLTDLKEVMVFESYKNGDKTMGMRRRYCTKDTYKALRDKRLNGAVKIDMKDLKAFKTSIKGPSALGTSVSASGTVDIPKPDMKKFVSSLAEIKASTKNEWTADPVVFNLFDGISGQLSDSVTYSDCLETERAAQWLRFVGGAGASAQVDWKKKRIELQGNLQGKLVGWEDKYTIRFAAPSLKGWLMKLDGEDLGALRITLELELYGFAGAKVGLTGTVGMGVVGNSTAVKAVERDRSDTLSNTDRRTRLPTFEPTGLNESIPKDLNGLKCEVDAFAGVEGSLTPKGMLQWLPPQSKDFVSFAELSATLAVSAGAGAQGTLYIYLQNGKFRIKVAARLCWGLGAKGSAEFVVDAGKILEFVKWVHNQLLCAGFKHLVYFQKEAFIALSKFLFLFISKESETGAVLATRFEQINADFEKKLTELDQARERNVMVNNINRTPEWLIYATPETRGMMLYQITRHSTSSHVRDTPAASTGNNLVDPEIHFLPTHKQAIINLLKPVQTKAEWDNIFQHMTEDSKKSTTPSGKNEGDVIRFLNNGVGLTRDLPSHIQGVNNAHETEENMPGVTDKMAPPNLRSRTDNKFLDDYFKMREALLGSFPKGYRLALNGSPGFSVYQYRDGETHPTFAIASEATLETAFADFDTHPTEGTVA